MISDELEDRILKIAQLIVQKNKFVYMGIIPVDEIRNEAIKIAREIAQEKGLKVGDPVAYSIDDPIYELLDINIFENAADIWIPANRSKDGKKKIKKVFLSELFDITVMKEITGHLARTVADWVKR